MIEAAPGILFGLHARCRMLGVRYKMCVSMLHIQMYATVNWTARMGSGSGERYGVQWRKTGCCGVAGPSTRHAPLNETCAIYHIRPQCSDCRQAYVTEWSHPWLKPNIKTHAHIWAVEFKNVQNVFYRFRESELSTLSKSQKCLETIEKYVVRVHCFRGSNGLLFIVIRWQL